MKQRSTLMVAEQIDDARLETLVNRLKQGGPLVLVHPTVHGRRLAGDEAMVHVDALRRREALFDVVVLVCDERVDALAVRSRAILASALVGLVRRGGELRLLSVTPSRRQAVELFALAETLKELGARDIFYRTPLAPPAQCRAPRTRAAAQLLH